MRKETVSADEHLRSEGATWKSFSFSFSPTADDSSRWTRGTFFSFSPVTHTYPESSASLSRSLDFR